MAPSSNQQSFVNVSEQSHFLETGNSSLYTHEVTQHAIFFFREFALVLLNFSCVIHLLIDIIPALTIRCVSGISDDSYKENKYSVK